MNNIIDIGKEQKFGRYAIKPPKPLEKTYSSMQQSQRSEIPDCAICYEQMVKDLAVFVPCGHTFHHKCLKNYSKLECPICRKQNIQFIPIHFSIEQNENKNKEIQQNKLIQIEQKNQQQNQNKEPIKKLYHLFSKGKEQLDHLLSQNIVSNQGNQNQKLNYMESLFQEITKTFQDYRNQIDSQNGPINQSHAYYTQLQEKKKQKLVNIGQKTALQLKLDSLIYNKQNKAEMSEKIRQSIHQYSRPQSQQNKSSFSYYDFIDQNQFQ